MGKPLDLRTGQIHRVALDGILNGDMLLHYVKCSVESSYLRAEYSIQARFISKDPNFFVLTGVKPE